MAADPWVPCASNVSIEFSLCTSALVCSLLGRYSSNTYVEGCKAGTVLIKCLEVELNELL